MQKNCPQCKTGFEITADDLKFYDKVSPSFDGKKYVIPPPKLCPDCRMQRRLAFRNERQLYHRKCDLTGKQIISMYSPEKPFPVYDRDVWWSDSFDPLKYGREFDFSQPFFEQFAELTKAVPRLSLNNKDSENSDYCNFGLQNKNCYLLFTSGYCEDSYYSNRIFHAKNCSDCSTMVKGELCYEVIDSENCYHSGWLQNCSNSSDCFFGYNLKGCHDCFACFNLTNAKFRIANKQYTEAEYRKKVASFWKNLDAVKANFMDQKKHMIRKYIDGVNVENCTGDAIFNSKNAHQCYEVKNIQDSKFLSNATGMKDCYDVTNDDNSELVYEAVGSESNYMHAFNDICWFDSDDYYNSLCFNSENIFGCVGLKKNQYCILNKQYTKEEYEKLVPKIIEHMIKNNEWGEFFPVSISPFGYNETLAQDFFPLSQAEVKKQGWNWYEGPEKGNDYIGKPYQIPARIEDVDDDITNHILTCEVTGRYYKIIPQELKFYRMMNIPIPRKHPDQRHKERSALRNPRKLWKRNCAKCKLEFQTSYAPERSETIYCEKCYLEAVY